MSRRVDTRAKLLTLQAGRKLRQGGLLAHNTSTLAGITALPNHHKAVSKAQLFKQRRKPFLLLADSKRTALKQAIWLPKALRQLANSSWPGAVTLVFPARKHLHEACYQKRTIAVRVDANPEVRRLANISGGLLLSSSLNRRGEPVANINHQLKFRWHRYFSTMLNHEFSSGSASSIFKVSMEGVKKIR